MENLTSKLFAEKNEMIQKGLMVEATDKYFAPHAKAADFDGTTLTKPEELKKLEGFVASIAKVNSITLHQVSNSDTVSFAEWTFDFDMKDGSKILWHEIIRSVWENGAIVHEQYFKA